MSYLQITTGRGPAECSLALHHLTAKLLQEVPGASLVRGSPYSSVVELQNAAAEGLVRPYLGTILWICNSPLRPTHKRKNWFLDCRMIEMPEPGDIVLRDEDLKYETMRASGPGGQSVNKSDSAVRLTHLPTGMVTTSQDERSQKQNKRLARERMERALKDKHAVQMAILERTNWSSHNELERGNPVKVFHGQEFVEKMHKTK
jgi:peptide chain release factor